MLNRDTTRAEIPTLCIFIRYNLGLSWDEKLTILRDMVKEDIF